MRRLFQNRVYYPSILLILLFTCGQLTAQVTIGSSGAPAKGAILDLKEKEIENPNNITNSTKGLGLPRVSLRSRTDLYPMFDATPEGSTPSANDKYDTPQKKANQDAMHVGLLVYNIGLENIESVETQLCKGLHIWNSTKWTPLVPYPPMTSIFDVVRCKPGGTFTVSNVVLSGVYKKGEVLGSSHYIDVTINASSDAIGTEYILKTYSPNNDGIGFSGTGTITSAQQVVRIYAEGAITNYGDKNLILTSNSSSIPQTQYPITIKVVMPVLRIVGVGSANYQPASTTAKSRKLLDNPNAFGTSSSSVVSTMGFTFESYTSATDANWIAIFQSKPDIVIRVYGTSMSTNIGPYVKAYLEAGGVFLEYNDNNLVSSTTVKALYGTQASSNTNSGDPGQLFKIENIDDEIVKGPWGDMAGKYWFEDASYTQGVSNVDENRIIIYSRTTKANNLVTCFRDKTLNYFYLGDGGNLSGSAAASSCCYPFQLDGNNMPTTGYQGNSNNAAFFANVFTWALKQATTNGINPR